MKKSTFICISILLMSCNRSSKNNSIASSDSSKNLEASVSKAVNNIAAVPNLTNLDSLNYIFTSQPDSVLKKYVNKTVRFTGSIENGAFILSKESSKGRNAHSHHGIVTDLNNSSFANIIQDQPYILIYDKSQKKCLDKVASTDYTPYELILKIYSASEPISPDRDSFKALGDNEAETNSTLKSAGLEAYNQLKSKYPGIATSLLNGNIVIINKYESDAPIMDFIIVDEVTIEGKILEMGENGLDKMVVKLLGTKIVKTKRILDLDKMPPFTPKFK